MIKLINVLLFVMIIGSYNAQRYVAYHISKDICSNPTDSILVNSDYRIIGKFDYDNVGNIEGRFDLILTKKRKVILSFYENQTVRLIPTANSIQFDEYFYLYNPETNEIDLLICLKSYQLNINDEHEKITVIYNNNIKINHSTRLDDFISNTNFKKLLDNESELIKSLNSDGFIELLFYSCLAENNPDTTQVFDKIFEKFKSENFSKKIEPNIEKLYFIFYKILQN